MLLCHLCEFLFDICLIALYAELVLRRFKQWGTGSYNGHQRLCWRHRQVDTVLCLLGRGQNRWGICIIGFRKYGRLWILRRSRVGHGTSAYARKRGRWTAKKYHPKCTKTCLFGVKNKNNCPSRPQTSPSGKGRHPIPTLHPFGASFVSPRHLYYAWIRTTSAPRPCTPCSLAIPIKQSFPRPSYYGTVQSVVKVSTYAELPGLI